MGLETVGKGVKHLGHISQGVKMLCVCVCVYVLTCVIACICNTYIFTY